MIGWLKGIVVDISGRTLLLDVGGVGYEVKVTSRLSASAQVSKPCEFFVHTDVNQDAIRLYGFLDKIEKEVFNLLIRVDRMGAKTATDILSQVNAKDLLKIIASGESTTLQKIKGIGKKTAERIVLELKDKVASGAAPLFDGFDDAPRGAPTADSKVRDACEALCALGFNKKDAEKALGSVTQRQAEVGDIVAEALRYL
jgi:Holliday junction DNA helicase RuvA